MATIAVTGAGSGIGAATAGRLTKSGHTVIGVDITNADIDADLGTVDGRRTAVAQVLARCDGLLDGLVCSAGIGSTNEGPKTVSVNFFGTVEVMLGLRPALAATGNAGVVAITSGSVTAVADIPADLVDACLAMDEPRARELAAGYQQPFPYTAAKLAVARYVRRRAPDQEWAGSGIRLNALAPGMVRTPMLDKLLSSALRSNVDDYVIPTGAPGEPDAIAFWIEAMLVGEGAPFLCGTVLFVDGGTDAQKRPDAWPATFRSSGERAVGR